MFLRLLFWILDWLLLIGVFSLVVRYPDAFFGVNEWMAVKTSSLLTFGPTLRYLTNTITPIVTFVCIYKGIRLLWIFGSGLVMKKWE